MVPVSPASAGPVLPGDSPLGAGSVLPGDSPLGAGSVLPGDSPLGAGSVLPANSASSAESPPQAASANTEIKTKRTVILRAIPCPNTNPVPVRLLRQRIGYSLKRWHFVEAQAG